MTFISTSELTLKSRKEILLFPKILACMLSGTGCIYVCVYVNECHGYLFTQTIDGLRNSRAILVFAEFPFSLTLDPIPTLHVKLPYIVPGNNREQ